MLDSRFAEMICQTYDGATLIGFCQSLKISRSTLRRIELLEYAPGHKYGLRRPAYNRKFDCSAFDAISTKADFVRGKKSR